MQNENKSKNGVLITGGSGLVGKKLTSLLLSKGYRVHHLSRTKKHPETYKVFTWNLSEKFIEPKAFEGIRTIIHLAGAGVVDKRWSKKRKKELIDSRVKSAELIYMHLANNAHTVNSFISASAIGWYGNTGDQIVHTDAPAANNFLAEICKQWEAAAMSFSKLGIREARVRIGLVMDKDGGVLNRLLLPMKFGIGAMLGNGSQFTSWIDNSDLAKIFLFLIENENTNGAYNGTAPETLEHKKFVKTIATAMNKRCLLVPSPTFAIRAVAGEMSSALLQDVRAYPKRLLAEGFQFERPELLDSLEKILA